MMRCKKEIEDEFNRKVNKGYREEAHWGLQSEVLLDIRELLISIENKGNE